MKHSCKFIHFRQPQYDVRGGDVVQNGISPQGGATVAYTEKDGKMYAAAAYCNTNDNFNFAYGRNKAAGRLTQLLSKPEKANDKYPNNTIYFIVDAGEGLDWLHHLFVYDNGYIHRGPRK